LIRHSSTVQSLYCFTECIVLLVSTTGWGWSGWETNTSRGAQWTCCTSHSCQMHSAQV